MPKKLSSKNITMEELLASQPQKLTIFHRGQEVEGEVVAISPKEIILDLGGKSEGILPARDSKDLKVGSILKAYVVLPENENGQVVLSLSPQSKISPSHFRGHGINWTRFESAQRGKSKLQGKVLEVNKGGLIVEVEGARGFLPNSQVGFELLSKSGAMEELIGENLTVTVIEVDGQNNKLIFSQRGQITKESQEKLKSFKAGQKEKGKIVAILPFGLVVEVNGPARNASSPDNATSLRAGASVAGGTEGLVFISDVSWDRLEDLSKDFKTGEELDVLVLGLDEELGRLNLSIKQLTEDPFVNLVKDYPADEVVKGEVVTVTDAGVAVKIKDNIEGFLPASKIGQVTYEAGKEMTFLVDSVDSGRRRINLAPFVISTAGLIYK